MTTPLSPALLEQAPKALLHDHLDGGLRPAMRDQQAHRLAAAGQCAQQGGQGRRLVAEQADQPLACPVNALAGQPGCAVVSGLACQQVGLAQQAPCAIGEAGVEKPLAHPRCRAVHHG